MTKTSIEWATDVWNPVTGCTKVSQGCKNCYAERIAERFWGERKFTDVQLHPERLEDPLHWKKTRRVFVNSMSDLFHPDVPDIFINRLLYLMEVGAPQHQYLILTKRPDRMRNYFKGVSPAKNIWLGVSVEDQKTADERIPLLLQTPAAVRFVSAEPLLDPVDLSAYLPLAKSDIRGLVYSPVGGPFLDWIICGGESGPHARPMHPDWARSLRDQCFAAGVPFFFKQWGEWLPVSQSLHLSAGKIADVPYHCWDADPKPASAHSVRVGKKAAGRLLDGREWNEYPGGEG